MTRSDDAAALFAIVEAAFAVTGRGFEPWPDPHADRDVADDEYSRVTDPERMRITGARADAWIRALVDLGAAHLERNADVAWRDDPRTRISRTDRLLPTAPGALPLVLARSEIAGVADAGLTIGLGDPAVPVTWIPDCGCDACDSGSDDLLLELDELFLGVVRGPCRVVRQGARQITVIGNRQQGTGNLARGEWERVLDDPTGWEELTGTPWLSA